MNPKQILQAIKMAAFQVVVLCMLFVFVPNEASAQCAGSGTSPMTLTSAGTCTWTCPAGVTEITVQTWGAGGGGGGGGAKESYINGGGGGGGAYSTGTYTVTPDFVYKIKVGAGGSAGIEEGVDGSDGGNTWFSETGAEPRFATEGILAEGGKGGETGPYSKPDGGTTKGDGGAGGAAANGFGNLHKNSGGDGGDSQYRYSGAGGGSSAGTSNGANGDDGDDDIDDNTTRSGGTAPAGGGNGGSSHKIEGAIAGTAPGGGGGGSDHGGNGAAGAAGKIVITWAVGCTPPVITTQPSHVLQEVCNGSAPIDLTIVATASGTPTYQWYSNAANSNIGGTLIGGAISDTYTPPTGSDGTTYYYVEVTDAGCSVVSNVSGAVIVYSGAPTITTNPVADQTVVEYSGVGEFEVAATGGEKTYQWQESTDGGGSWSNITDGGVYSGATTATLLVTDPPFWMNGYDYKCVISSCASATSTSGNLTVVQQAVTEPCEGSTVTYGVPIPEYNTDGPAGNDVTYEWDYPTTNGWSLSSGGGANDNEIALVIGTSDETVRVRFVGPCADNGPWRSVTVTPVSAVGVWMGGVDNKWSESGNWCGVPACETVDATIPTDPVGGRFPEIDANGANCKNLTIETGAYLTTSTTYTLGVCGNWTNNGTYAANSGAIHFIGAADQTIGGTGTQTFYDLVINNPGVSESDDVILSKPVSVSNTLTLTDGIITSDATNLLTLTNTATTATTGGNTEGPSFVKGPIRWNGLNGAGPFIFPTGAGTSDWARVAVADVTASTDFTCQFFNTSHSNTDSRDMATTPTPVLEKVSKVEYWDIDRTSGAGNAAVQLYWEDNTASVINSCATNGNLVIGHYTGGKWENGNSSGAVVVSGSCGSNDAGSVKSDVMTSFSPFTFGTISLVYNPLPIELLNFTATNHGENVDLAWETASEIHNDYFTVERSTDGVEFNIVQDYIPSKASGGNSTSILTYETKDHNLASGTYYYRLKQTDFDGQFEYSEIRVVEVDANGGFTFNIYPNPNNGGALFTEIFSEESKEILFVVHNTLGQLIYTKVIITGQYENTVYALDINQKLEKGIYMVIATSDNKSLGKRLIVK